MARDNTQKTINTLLEGMQDWNPDIRAKSAATFAAFLLYCEENVTGYMGAILPILYKILSGDDQQVMKEVFYISLFSKIVTLLLEDSLCI